MNAMLGMKELDIAELQRSAAAATRGYGAARHWARHSGASHGPVT
jgi:hypothetical protein